MIQKKLLLHVCCAPCASYVLEKLTSENYDITAFFYNPNIYPQSEYEARLNDFILFADKLGYKYILKSDEPQVWFDYIKGFEDEQEKGKRCNLCFKMRLETTAIWAKENCFDYFTTVLSISPHKNSNIINQIGKKLEEKYNIEFLESNFKKQDGFKKSLGLSEKYNLYRQNYCGCEFSIIK